MTTETTASASVLATSPPMRPIAERIAEHARLRPAHSALDDGSARLDYAALDASMDAVAAALRRSGVRPGDAIAICAATSVQYAVAFLGALRAGVVVAPLAPSVTAAALRAMLADAEPRLIFVDAGVAALLDDRAGLPQCVALDGSGVGRALADWLDRGHAVAAAPGAPAPAAIDPATAFNIIYSSGTTGAPKGIVQSHAMRNSHVERASRYGYDERSVALLATPLYSNTTLVVFFPALAYGSTVVLMPKFDADGYLALAERHRATHTMLVPVQYRRIMASERFGGYDLSSFRFKFSTSAPFDAALKADVLARWPGELVEFYGMTEGGGTCILEARANPGKLHTVGPPAEGHDIRLIDDADRELPRGASGEVVGHSPGMMTGYHRQPAKTAEAEWFDATGKRFIRTGDIGHFDDDGFLVLVDRKKDMIISGGFNVFPSDLEAVLREHPAVVEAAVAGVASERWGETPVAWVVLRDFDAVDAGSLREWVNTRVGKTQRLADLRLVDALPRSAIGKVLKRELREAWAAQSEGEGAVVGDGRGR